MINLERPRAEKEGREEGTEEGIQGREITGEKKKKKKK